MKKTVLFITLGLFLFLGGCTTITWVVKSNKEVKLRNKVLAQQDVCKEFYDNMFKSIAQVAEVADVKMEKSKEAFKEIYPALIEGRYSGEKGGALMKWVTESNPQFDLNAAGSLYDKLANVIEAKRSEFFMEQKKLTSYQQEHKNILQTWPGSWFLAGRDTVPVTIITSAKTKEVYATGEENDIQIFKKDS
jgi:hypothetical protein